MKTFCILVLFIGCSLASPLSKLSDYNEEKDVPQAFRRQETVPEEEPEPFEGDIELTPETKDEVDMSEEGDIDGPLKPHAKRGVATHQRNMLWPGGVVPYEIDQSASDATENIGKAIQMYHDKTCIRWKKREDETSYVRFVNLTGCHSPIGRIGKQPQKISIGKGCNYVGTIIHEMMHSIGFWHTQSRPDRNDYVEIMWENIRDGMAHNFNKYGLDRVDIQSLPYDQNSILHYNNKAFSKNGKQTIKPSNAAVAAKMGQRDALSVGDVTAINKLYSCHVKNGGWSPWSTFTPCNPNCLKTRSRYCTNKDASACAGSAVDNVACTTQECNAPVDGHWGRWASWGACSTTCDVGVKTRSRKCDDPIPKNAGANCPAGGSTSTASCRVKPCDEGPGDCDFEDSNRPFCNSWEPDSTTTAGLKYPNWLRHSGETPSKNTGPSGDHTPLMGGKGFYMYAEVSQCPDGARVRTKSIKFPATTARCLTLFYNINGETGKGFNIYVRKSSGEEKIFSETGNLGNVWKELKKTISSKDSDYWIVLETVCGRDYRGDNAVDDIKFLDGACP